MNPTGIPVDAPVERPATPWGARILLALVAFLFVLVALACDSNSGGGDRAANAGLPKIQSFTPVSGIAGATTVTLTGTGFTRYTSVKFGDVAATTARGAGDTQITVQVPAGAATGAITVVTPRGSHTSAAHFQVLPRQVLPPVVSGFQPAQGAPGATVVLAGTGFTGVTQVAFGGVAATEFWERGGTAIEARVPAGAVTGPLSVVTPAGTGTSEATFTVIRPLHHQLPPAVTAFTPAQGAPGTRVVVTGDHLAGATVVSFNGMASPRIEPQDDQTLAAYVPVGATTGPIAVATPGGTGASAADFTVLAAPALAIAGFEPDHGAPGDLVTLDGTGFAGATEVFFGGVATVPVGDVTDTHLTAAVPAGAITGPVSVLVPGGFCTSATDFTVIGGGPAPTLPGLTGANPTHGRPGALVLLTGTGLQGTAQVDFGPASALEFRAVDDTTVLAEVPPAAATGMITLATAAGLAQFGPFTVDAPLPMPLINTFNPPQGLPGTEVTIQGTGLAGATEVTFNGERALGQVLNPDGSLTTLVPANALSGPITVVTPGGIGRSANDFDVLPAAPPLPTGLLPGAAAPGDLLMIFGSGLDQVDAVAFTGPGNTQVLADEFSTFSEAVLDLTVPAQAVTGPVYVVHHGNRIAVPGNLTVLPARPAITGFNPVQGIPGTEVTLTGSNFANATQVTFNGAALDASRWNVSEDGTQVRVRVSDQGEAGVTGLIAVVTPGGTATTVNGFQFQESRLNTLVRPLARPQDLPQLDFPDVHRAAPYGLGLPQAPVFHPLYPSPLMAQANGLEPSRPGQLVTSFTLNFRLPRVFYPALPETLRAELLRRGIAPANLAILLASQHNIYNGDPERAGYSAVRDDYEFKPQYWLYPDALIGGGADNTSIIEAGLFTQETLVAGAEQGLTLNGFTFGAMVIPAVSVTLGPGAADPQMLAGFGDTGAGIQRMVLGGVDYRNSYGFWTLTVAGGQAAATLHLLLNDDDQGILDLLAADGSIATLEQFFDRLSTTAFTELPRLASLLRPAVTATRRLAVVDTGAQPAQDTGMDQITLDGDLFTGVLGVELDGQDLPPDQIMVDSDAHMRVLVPRNAAGDLQVITEFGISDLIHLH